MIDFLRYRGLIAAFSVILVVACVSTFAYRRQTRGHAFNWSVDFTGGWQGLFKFDKSVSAQRIKEMLDKQWAGVTTREFAADEIMVRVKDVTGDPAEVGNNMRTTIQTAIPDNPVTLVQTEYVGAAVGQSLQTKTIYAIIITLIVMLLYIALRFWSFGFAFGAVLALVHDALVMLAFFLFTDREISISVIGAILAVLGYSINDTIVIFSQIRDNLPLMRSKSLYEVVNLSLNQTLKRTLLTSFTTAISIAAMIIFGGEVLRDFALTWMVGVIFGTYSSIYIASPIMMMFYR